MIKAEKTIIKGRIDLVDTKKKCGIDNDYLIRHISEEEAIYLFRSLSKILYPESVDKIGDSK